MSREAFDYLRAETVGQALDLLAANPEAAVLTSGHSLLPALKSGQTRPRTVVDIGEIDSLNGITVDDDAVRIGAATTYTTLVNSDPLERCAPPVPAAAAETADRQIRNRGTVGGNLAHPYPVSDLSAACVAANATLVARSPHDRRRLNAEAFFTGERSTALAEAELLIHVEVPAMPGIGGTYIKRTCPSSRYTLVGVAAQVRVADDTATEVGVATVGATERVARLSAVEDALEGEVPSTERLETAATQATASLDEPLVDDDQASASSRANLLAVDTERALEQAVERARTSASGYSPGE